jgi:hypothetical protein
MHARLAAYFTTSHSTFGVRPSPTPCRTGDSGSSEPGVYCGLDPLWDWIRPDMSRLALDVHDHPMFLANLDGIHRHGQKFAAPEAAPD